MLKRVVVAMSGGVDSSVTAYLLKEMGYEVIGITMDMLKLSCQIENPNTCCSLQAFKDAHDVADKLGIRHHLLDCKTEFEQEVISCFVNEYLAGQTPNPCVICNSKIKFGLLLDKAKNLGADYLATGHYAIISRQDNRFVIKKSIDLNKDQSYFLYRLSQKQLGFSLMPLGRYKKEEVRKIASNLKLNIHNKPESQEICFIPEGHYYDFIKERLKSVSTTSLLSNIDRPGKIVDKNGKLLGEHSGIASFTVGQRKGLGISAPTPRYVLSIDSITNTLVVGEEYELYQHELIAINLNWVAIERLNNEMEVIAKIRYLHPGAKAIISPLPHHKIMVRFKEPQRAITPGQSVVFYQDDLLIGGGIIE